MINKKESKRIWKWKAAAFLPVACVLLMSFSNKLEKAEIQKLPITKEMSITKDNVRHWTKADFTCSVKQEKEYLDMPNVLFVKVDQDYGSVIKMNKLINSYFCSTQIILFKHKYDENLFLDNTKSNTKLIRSVLDYNFSSKLTKDQFSNALIAGKEEMVSNYKIVISRGDYVGDNEYQKAFDLVGRTLEKVKDDFSEARYRSRYRNLNIKQKSRIDKLVPVKVFYLNERHKEQIETLANTNKFKRANDARFLALKENNLVFLYSDRQYLWLNGHITDQYSNNRIKYIKRYFDYYCADSSTKKLFKEVIINGVKLMAPTANIYVEHENTTLQKSGIECLNQLVSHISKIFLRIKEKNSKLVYLKSYTDLSLNEKANIDSLLPNKIISGGKELHFDKGINAISKRNKVYLVEKLLPKDIKKDIDLNKSKINSMSIIINNDSMIYINRKLVALEDTFLEETFLKYIVYSKADANTDKYFKSVTINGKKVMISKVGLNIMYESSFENNAKDVIRRLDVLRLRVKNNFANDIFSRPYNELSVKEQHQISKLIPFYSIGNVNRLSLKAI